MSMKPSRAEKTGSSASLVQLFELNCWLKYTYQILTACFEASVNYLFTMTYSNPAPKARKSQKTRGDERLVKAGDVQFVWT